MPLHLLLCLDDEGGADGAGDGGSAGALDHGGERHGVEAGVEFFLSCSHV